jgi:phosphoribosylanthranilate isomerase
MKVYRVADRLDVAVLAERYPGACCLMLDTFVQGQPGGTGRSFDWSLWPKATNLKLVLAGGLTPENVSAAIQATRPFAVDVSGGVEGPDKGIKDAERIRQFVTAVRQVDS